jgi:hypothetical protein
MGCDLSILCWNQVLAQGSTMSDSCIFCCSLSSYFLHWSASKIISYAYTNLARAQDILGAVTRCWHRTMTNFSL